MKKITLFIILILSIGSCLNNDDQMIPDDDNQITPVNEKDFLAFEAIFPFNEVLFDSIDNRIYVFERGENARIICYDYESLELVNEVEYVSTGTNYDMAIGKHLEQTEIYASGGGRIVYVYNGELDLIDSLEIFEESDPRIVISIEFQTPNLLFIGACNGGLNDTEGALSFNRTTKQVISESTYGGNCLRIRSFRTETPSSTTIGVVGVGYSTSKLSLNEYTTGGELIDNKIEFFPDGISQHLLIASNNSDYIISNQEGNFYYKDDLSKFASLDGSYNDFIINKSEDIIYGITRSLQIEKFEYPSLDKLAEKELERTAVRGIIDDGKLILVYFSDITDELLKKKVYISKIDLF
jgi:hypothetical protein